MDKKASAGRRPASEGSSKEEILKVAKSLFMAQGFAKTSIRAIARVAKVDPSLILHFFGGKEGLFAATINPQATAQTIFEGLKELPKEEWPSTLASRILRFLSPGLFLDTLIIVQRAAASEPKTAALLARLYREQFLGEMSKLGLDNFEARATLLSSVTTGITFTSYIVGLEGFRQAPESLKLTLLTEVIRGILLSPVPESD